MHAHRQLLFVGLLLGALAIGCAGRGSGGFDISDRAQLTGASELAVSNLQTLIDFGQRAASGGGAQSAAEDLCARAQRSGARTGNRDLGWVGPITITPALSPVEGSTRTSTIAGGGDAVTPNDLQCTPDGFCLECVEANGIFTATSFFVGAPRGAECPPECRRDEIFLSSTDPGTCEGEVGDDIPVGCGFRNYSREWQPGSANLIDFAALFEPSGQGTGCAEPQSFGLVTPAFNVCTESSKGTMTLDGYRSDVDGADHRFARFTGFSVDLVADGDPCVVHATLNGHVERRSSIGGGFSGTYDNFLVTEREEGTGVVLVTQDGTLTTDCVGAVEYETIEPLRLAAGEPCPTAGLLRITLPNGTQSLTRYTANGGVEIDFGADNVVDETFASCTDPALSLCQVEEPVDLCATCESDDDCGDGLVCLPCSFDCAGDTKRCVEPDDLGGCEDGIY